MQQNWRVLQYRLGGDALSRNQRTINHPVRVQHSFKAGVMQERSVREETGRREDKICSDRQHGLTHDKHWDTLTLQKRTLCICIPVLWRKEGCLGRLCCAL